MGFVEDYRCRAQQEVQSAYWNTSQVTLHPAVVYYKDGEEVKGCVRYIFAGLFFKSKGQHLENKEKCFLFHFKSSFRSRENQIVEF